MPIVDLIPTVIYKQSLFWSCSTMMPDNTWCASNSLLKWLYKNTATVFCRKCSLLEYAVADSGR